MESALAVAGGGWAEADRVAKRISVATVPIFIW